MKEDAVSDDIAQDQEGVQFGLSALMQPLDRNVRV
jgi:hypothetical protein